MSLEQMRYAIQTAFKGESWRIRVASMGDRQVVAVYHRLLSARKV